MRQLLAGLAALALVGGSALAQPAPPGPVVTRPASKPPPPPTLKACAGVYAALARQQTTFGTDGSLLGERFSNFAKIDYEARIAELGRKTETGVSELKSLGQSDPADFYDKLVNAETEGEIETPEITELARVANACDAQYAFTPSLAR